MVGPRLVNNLKTKGNTSTIKPEINHKRLKRPCGFIDELRKQIPGLRMTNSTMWKYVNLREGYSNGNT